MPEVSQHMMDLLAKPMQQNPIIDGYLLLDSLVTTTGINTIRCINISTPLFSGFHKMRIISNPDDVPEKIDYFSRLKYLSQKVIYPSGPLFLEEGEFNGCPYFVEKYVWGKQLLTVHRSLKAQDREFGVGFSTLIAYRVARILQAVSLRTHVAEPSDMLLHGMLTPKNVVIGYDGEVFVINYGLTSRVALDDFCRARGRNSCSSEGMNIFSAGVLLLEMLLGLFPFSKMSLDKQLETFHSIDTQGYGPIFNDLPAPLATCVKKALQCEYETFDQFNQDLIVFFKSIKIAPSNKHIFYLMNEHFKDAIFDEFNMLRGLAEANQTHERRIHTHMVQIAHDVLKAGIFS